MSSSQSGGQAGAGASGNEYQEYEPAKGTQEAGSKNEGAGNNPAFSLAGPGANNPASNAYVGDQYMEYNPQYGQPNENPTWSLAQPLPHIVRPGMQHGALPEDRKEDKQRIENGQPVNESSDKPDDEFFNTWTKIRHALREPLAEWLGTTVAMTIGLCATLSNFTSSGQAGTYTSQSVAWGFGFMVAIYITGGISGGHLNPAFSIAMSIFRGFPARKCIQYIAAQLLGAITAGGISYAIYHDAILEVVATSKLPQNASVAATAMITAPKSFVHPATAFFTEFLGSAILFGAIVALGDDTNAPPGAGMQAFILGILISIVVLALGYNTGGCFNCARDFGPRLVALMAGWGGQLFREYHAWWVWGPWCADISGALFGAFMYDLAIFTGGESPLNYPPRRRKRALRVRTVNLRKKLGLGPKKRTRDLEKSISGSNS
ncbi:uncharacterized protein N7469_011519 [Penicillium citrinum]|uniref:Aquaporin n=2 Tax=Penicillium TaxID=5073 RepID=A0A9W9TCZ1_PENCI|nr:uncharacterized protein N7469_011519 [Penicillium citrinum]KAJ5217894.1 hypothetical protein N7469_011519 [Penicillium citrinum]KAJ5575223.1 hypothetical protein N7450_009122 [Penicillium hetheringtonii]